LQQTRHGQFQALAKTLRVQFGLFFSAPARIVAPMERQHTQFDALILPVATGSDASLRGLLLLSGL
tara:strand:+ start:9905 stop:10102 length:198 start_codon:yes stop_codon:yes gene_type:complete